MYGKKEYIWKWNRVTMGVIGEIAFPLLVSITVTAIVNTNQMKQWMQIVIILRVRTPETMLKVEIIKR